MFGEQRRKNFEVVTIVNVIWLAFSKSFFDWLVDLSIKMISFPIGQTEGFQTHVLLDCSEGGASQVASYPVGTGKIDDICWKKLSWKNNRRPWEREMMNTTICLKVISWRWVGEWQRKDRVSCDSVMLAECEEVGCRERLKLASTQKVTEEDSKAILVATFVWQKLHRYLIILS